MTNTIVAGNPGGDCAIGSAPRAAEVLERSLEFQFYAYGFVDYMKRLCMK
jgi:hypothetical protein